MACLAVASHVVRCMWRHVLYTACWTSDIGSELANKIIQPWPDKSISSDAPITSCVIPK